MTVMKLSIVTINYNQGKYLERCISSVLEQKSQDIEYIVIDGGSTDSSAAIIEQYSSQLDYYVSEPDEGPPNALNKGLAQATGDIFGFINADDFFLPGSLKRIETEFQRTPGVDVIYGHGIQVDESGRTIRPLYSDRWNLRRYLLSGCTILQQATFIRMDAIRESGGFHEENSTCWDGELWVDLALHGARWRRIDACLAAFRTHDESISSQKHDTSVESEYQRDKRRIRSKVVERFDPPRWLHWLHMAEKRLADPQLTCRNFYAWLQKQL